MKKTLEKIVSDIIESGKLELGRNGDVKEFTIGYYREIQRAQQSVINMRLDIHYFEFDMEFIKTIYINDDIMTRYINMDKRDRIISELLD